MVNSDVEIFNMALSLLQEQVIASFDDDDRLARWAKLNYDTTRDSLLSLHHWVFAIVRAEIPAEEGSPEFGWEYTYKIPSDCLRLLSPRYDGEPSASLIDYEISNGLIYTDVSGKLEVRYVRRETDVAKYPATFVQALSSELAFMMSHFLTDKTSFMQIANNIRDQAIGRAKNNNDIMSSNTYRAVSDAWTNARLYRGGYYYHNRVRDQIRSN